MSKNRPFPPPGGEGMDSPPGEAMDNVPCFEAVTEDVRVVVQTFWLDDQSEPDEHRYVWAYRVRIENHGTEQIQLLRRSWRIVDGQGRIDRVDGDGVVGEQPLIDASGSFEYMSGAALETPTGFMGGMYHTVSYTHLTLPTILLV